MFLIQADGRALRLVAKQQNGEVMLDIPFTKPVQLKKSGTQVIVDQQRIIFDAREEARLLSCLIEAADTYLFRRKATHFSVQAFTFWLIVAAGKRGYKKFLFALYPSLSSSNAVPVQHDDPESQWYQVTASLARELLKGKGIRGPRCGFQGEGNPSTRDLGWLYWAIWIVNPHLVQLLLLEGLTATDNPWHNLPPLHIAALYGHDDVAHNIVASSSENAKTLAREKDTKDCQALYYAACYGQEKVARSLLTWGAEVDHVSNYGETALHAAAEQGHTDVVQLLLENGAREDARDADEMTPLLLACEFKRDSVIALFAQKQLDFTLRDKDGRNAWQIAINMTTSGPMVSQSTYDLIMQSYWARDEPQAMPLPTQRRAIVSFEIAKGTEWATLTLDSRYARFEHPNPLPSHAINVFERCIKIQRPVGITEWSSRLTTKFHIIYAYETLDFSTAHGTRGTLGGAAWTELKITGGGQFRSSTRESAPEFQSHKNIATDPNAEEVS